MTLYFFDILGADVDADPHGTCLPTIEAARAYALKLASILVQESPRYLRDEAQLTIAIRTDEAAAMTITIVSANAS